MRSAHDYRRSSDDGPAGYFLTDQLGWDETCSQILGAPAPSRTLSVYSRALHITTVGSSGAAKFDFSDLCIRNIGPADYITIASTFPIIIIDNVPILTLAKKNEARRFITLLDALYECRVKLLIRAVSPPETLFFPDADVSVHEDLLWTESYTKAHLDMTTPYRPNISTYTGENVIERNVPLVDRPVDSSKLTAFTGEDERFAFRRAVSRLFEMPSKKWWETQIHAPIMKMSWTQGNREENGEGDRKEREFRHFASPFRVSEKKPPSFFDGHFWGVMRWGRKAGRWGMGNSIPEMA
jgi:peroxisome-assembly ATPase